MNELCQAAVITNGTVSNAIFAEESSVVTLVADEKDCLVDLDVIAIVVINLTADPRLNHHVFGDRGNS